MLPTRANPGIRSRGGFGPLPSWAVAGQPGHSFRRFVPPNAFPTPPRNGTNPRPALRRSLRLVTDLVHRTLNQTLPALGSAGFARRAGRSAAPVDGLHATS